MHIERLTIEAGDNTFALDLHPRLTVIAGVGRLERQGLIGELIGGLSTGRPGISLDLCSDGGDRYRLERGDQGRARVIETATGHDLTMRFANSRGRVDLVERVGLTPREAKRAMRFSEEDVETTSLLEQRVDRLARLDQNRLWDVARKVKDREAAVAEFAGEISDDPRDAAVIEEIERRHADFEKAQNEHEVARRVSLLIGANACVGGLLLAMLINPWIAAPAVAVAIATTAYSIVYWRRMEDARRDEDRALDAAGAGSYLGFQITRVNGLVADDHLRRQMMQAAEYHRAAVTEWTVLAGDVTVDWALAHRSEIRAAAGDRDRPKRTSVDAAGTTAQVADVSRSLHARLHSLRSMGTGHESFPMLLDEPFTRLDPAATADILQTLLDASAFQQIVLLTEDEAIASWARAEAVAGSVGLVEPQSHEPERRMAGSKHAAA